jgi:putative endonuclease
MTKYYYVYILSNFTDTVLYVGVTGNLVGRVYRHKHGLGSVFTKKYNVNKLVHYEQFTAPLDAIKREKQLKCWSRAEKDKLIDKENPERRDLYQDIL